MTIDIIVSSTGDHVIRGPRLVADQSVIFNNVAQSVKSGSRGGVGDRNVGVCDDARGECDARADGDGSPELSEVMMVNVDCLGTRTRRRTTRGRPITSSCTVSVPESTHVQNLSRYSFFTVLLRGLPVLIAFQLGLLHVTSLRWEGCLVVVSTTSAGYGYAYDEICHS